MTPTTCFICAEDHEAHDFTGKCDYEPCGYCNFDHAYEYADAVKAHAALAINAARQHAHEGLMSTSSAVALFDAEASFDEGHYIRATERAIRSLAYSVGIFHRAYREVQAIFG